MYLQLDELRLVVSSQERWLPNSAVHLRTSISEQLQVRIHKHCIVSPLFPNNFNEQLQKLTQGTAIAE